MTRPLEGQLPATARALAEAQRIPSVVTQLHWPEVLRCPGGPALERLGTNLQMG